MDEDTYTKEFFERHVRDYRRDYGRMARWLVANLDFDSVVDLGCGSGLMIAEMLDAGKRVLGLDGCENALTTPANQRIRPFLRFADLRRPIESPADLVICTEVAEHLAPAFGDVLIESITRSARSWVYFSGATPGQGGDHHVNERPHEYWIERFEKRGFRLVRDASSAFRRDMVGENGFKPWWFRKNALIFEKSGRRREERPPERPPSRGAAMIGDAVPDTAALSTMAPAVWRALGRRLRAIGVDSSSARPYVERAAQGRRAVVKWELRRRREAGAHAMRMLTFSDPVTPDEARAALGGELSLDQALASGFLRAAEGGSVVSPFSLKAVSVAGEERAILCDELARGGEAVMGPSDGTLVFAAFSRPEVRTRRALDVGCGAGTLALAVAPACEHVTASDINPRAIALAQVNAWMNGVDNVDFRLGDLMSPVADESFDLIVSQPPFVPQPEGMPPVGYLFGGPRGDELPLRLLGQIAPHLTPGGLSITLAGWPIVRGDAPLIPRLREAAGASPALSMLVLYDAGMQVADFCTAYGAIHHLYESAEQEQDVIRYREHFQQKRIVKVVHAYAVMRREPTGHAGWTSGLEFGQNVEIPASRRSLDALLAEADRTVERSLEAQPSSPTPTRSE
jgi:methylase of polypeptide subunit release factors